MRNRAPKVIRCPECGTPAPIESVSAAIVSDDGKEKAGRISGLKCPVCLEKRIKYAKRVDRAAEMREKKKSLHDGAYESNRAARLAAVERHLGPGSKVSLTGARKRAAKELRVCYRTILRSTIILGK